MLTVLALTLAAAGTVDASASPTTVSATSLSGAIGLNFGQVPGDGLTLGIGVSHRVRRFSFGLEAQFLPPGATFIANKEVAQFTGRELPVVGWPDEGVGSRGLGVTGLVPLCFQDRGLGACAVVAAGAVSVDSVWQPLVSAGARLMGEYPAQSSVRLRATVQVLGGILRPSGTVWSASPVQLSANLGLVVDAG
ncbi:MAG: hypothetical protein Q8S33_22530 [Myxococcales bacterium]|nr:hypothetical protein [Myxococcales bacterium]MDP3503126.1 hypothetical protein [Myxococcales bacterium]